jgi:hypothetical protein
MKIRKKEKRQRKIETQAKNPKGKLKRKHYLIPKKNSKKIYIHYLIVCM